LKNLLGVVICGLGTLFAFPAAALSDTVFTVYDASDDVFAQLTVTDAEAAANGSSFIYELSNASLANTAEFGNPTAVCGVVNTACGDGEYPYSDVFGIFHTGSGPNSDYLGFALGDASGNPYASLAGIFLAEGDGIFSATEYLSPSLQNEGYTAVFDNNVTPTPEPSSFVPRGVGLAALAFAAHRKRRARRSGRRG